MSGLIRRRAMIGGASLPYDAEVEYIEADGTQWIDSGVTFVNRLRVTVSARYTARYASTQVLFGPTGNGGCWCGNINNMKWGCSSAASGGNSSVKTSVGVYYDGTNTKLFLNGVFSGQQNRSLTPANTVGIFATGTGEYLSSAMVYDIFLEDYDHDVLFDGIPVRVGTVGYLYDRVTGRLFGNAGSGAFIVGPDV